MVQYTVSGGSDKSALAIVTVDSPRVILAVDPLEALLEFAMSPFKQQPTSNQAAQIEDGDPSADVVEGPKQAGSLAFRVEIIDSTVIVLANDSDSRSQAIHLNVKEVLVSQQSVLAVKVDKLGMSFGRMDRPNDRVRFLDELNVAFSLDTRRRGSQQMTSFEVDIPDPVIFRASYSDIMLIVDIINKASAAATRASGTKTDEPAAHGRRESIATDGMTVSTSTVLALPDKTSTRRSSVSKRRRSSVDKSKVIISKEQVSRKTLLRW